MTTSRISQGRPPSITEVEQVSETQTTAIDNSRNKTTTNIKIGCLSCCPPLDTLMTRFANIFRNHRQQQNVESSTPENIALPTLITSTTNPDIPTSVSISSEPQSTHDKIENFKRAHKDLDPIEEGSSANIKTQLNQHQHIDSNISTNATPKKPSFEESNALNLQQGQQRLARLFSKDKKPDFEARKKEAETAIDYYLANNTFYLGTETRQTAPKKLRDLLVLLDLCITDLHEAFEYGRGNVDVRNRFSLAGKNESRPDDFNLNEMFAKNFLTYLGHENFQSGEEDPRPPLQRGALERSLRSVANGILMGSASCGQSARGLAVVVMDRLSQLELSDKESFKINIVNELSVNGHEGIIDHVVCVATYKDETGLSVEIVLDPWSEMNTPLLKEHSRFNFDESKVSASFTNPNLPYQEKISSYMNEASSLIEDTKNSFGFQHAYSRHKKILQSADPHNKNYSLTQPHERLLVLRENLNMAKENVKLPNRNAGTSPMRRMSMSSATNNPLVQAALDETGALTNTQEEE